MTATRIKIREIRVFSLLLYLSEYWKPRVELEVKVFKGLEGV